MKRRHQAPPSEGAAHVPKRRPGELPAARGTLSCALTSSFGAPLKPAPPPEVERHSTEDEREMGLQGSLREGLPAAPFVSW